MFPVRFKLPSQSFVFLLFIFLFFYNFHGEKQQKQLDDRKILTEDEVKLLKQQYLLEDSEAGKSVGYTIANIKVEYNNSKDSRIAIVSVLRTVNQTELYDIAISTVKCYAKIHGYHYILADEKDFDCYQKDKFFTRHCIVAKILVHFDYVLFLDADIGVANPIRKIEEFMSPDFDIIFYDRFYNWEIMTGSYLVKNTQYAVKFLEDFADYESTLPNSFHGTDNGAIHFFFAERFFPEDSYTIDLCRHAYNASVDFNGVFIYEACLRTIFGRSRTDFDRVKVLRKGTGWARDAWITNSLWNKEDGPFMFHDWKTETVQKRPSEPVSLKVSVQRLWYNPLMGPIHLEKCHPRNSTWSYDPQLFRTSEEIASYLEEYRNEITRKQFHFFYRMKAFV